MRMYIIYERPLDYPLGYVVRGTDVDQDGVHPDPIPLALVPTLVAARWEIRKQTTANCVIPRDPSDALSIVETWV